MTRRKGHLAKRRPPGGVAAGRAMWIYGVHPVVAALANPRREIRRLLTTAEAAGRLPADSPQRENAAPEEIAAVLPAGAVHQGLAVLTEPLPETDIQAVCAATAGAARAVVVVLDRVADPHNVGAILRSAAAFGAAAVIVPERHAPRATGALAKAASGALETVPLVRATNLARALETLKQSEFWCVGLDAAAQQRIDGAALPARAALVLGAEGAGLRRLTRESCDFLVRVPIGGAVGSLNVSAAAAVALYEFARGRGQ